MNVHLRYHRTEHYGKRFRVTIEICGVVRVCLFGAGCMGTLWDGCCEKEKKKYENIFIKQYMQIPRYMRVIFFILDTFYVPPTYILMQFQSIISRIFCRVCTVHHHRQYVRTLAQY